MNRQGLVFCQHPDGRVHPLRPYPDESLIAAEVLDHLDPRWRDPETPDVLEFAEHCRYLIGRKLPELNAYELIRVP